MTYIHFYDHPYLALAGAISAAAGLVAMIRLAAPNFDALLSSARVAMAMAVRSKRPASATLPS
jgi:hypothetical protein